MTSSVAQKTIPPRPAPPPAPQRPALPANVPPPPAPPPAPIAPPDPAAAAKPATRPPARFARFETRHRMILLSFVLAVVGPSLLTAAYLWTMAADQFHSRVGFSVRLEESSPAMSLLSGLSGISGSSSSDTDILFEFIQSQNLVAEIDAELDLRALWSKPQGDPVFALDPDAPLEDLVDYWNDMVHLTRGKSAGLLEVEVRAFAAGDATLISSTLFAKSSEMINHLSAIAREDAIRYAREDLEVAVERLKTAREAVTQFRNLHQLVNPDLDIQSQAGLLANLQNQQAAALVEIDLLRDTARADDPRLVQAERKLQVIENRIAAERDKLGIGSGSEDHAAWADLIGEYERLAVDREFAERAYVSAMASYDTAVAESRRQSRYLAAYMEPTRAETSIYPKRVTLLAALSLFLALGWSIGLLIYYSIRDRR